VNSIYSNDTITSRSTIGGGSNNADQAGDSFSDTNGQPTSATQQDKENNNSQMQGTAGQIRKTDTNLIGVDPVTGMELSLEMDSKYVASDKPIDTENDQEVRGSSGVSNPTNSESNTGSDHVQERKALSGTSELTIGLKGTDDQGNSVDLQEKLTNGSSGGDDITDDETLGAGGIDNLVFVDFYNGYVILTDYLEGTIAWIDQATSVKIVQTFKDFLTSSGTKADTKGDVITVPPTGSQTDIPHSEDDETVDVQLNTNETKMVTYPDASQTVDQDTATKSRQYVQRVIDETVVELQDPDLSPATPVTVPTVDGVTRHGNAPPTGSSPGGEVVEITGTGFIPDSQVTFGGVPAMSVHYIGSSRMYAVTPAHPPGTVDVQVSNESGTSATNSSDQFTFNAPPAGTGSTPGSQPGQFPPATGQGGNPPSGSPAPTGGTSHPFNMSVPSFNFVLSIPFTSYQIVFNGPIPSLRTIEKSDGPDPVPVAREVVFELEKTDANLWADDPYFLCWRYSDGIDFVNKTLGALPPTWLSPSPESKNPFSQSQNNSPGTQPGPQVVFTPDDIPVVQGPPKVIMIPALAVVGADGLANVASHGIVIGGAIAALPIAATESGIFALTSTGLLLYGTIEGGMLLWNNVPVVCDPNATPLERQLALQKAIDGAAMAAPAPLLPGAIKNLPGNARMAAGEVKYLYKWVFPDSASPGSMYLFMNGGTLPGGSRGARAPAEATEWVRPKGWRLPRKGKWEGTPGHSNFKPDNPAELGLKPGEVIPFREGIPDLSKWSKGNFTSEQKLTGVHGTDQTKMIRQLAESKGWSVAQTEAWLTTNEYVLHHAGGQLFQLIDARLHGATAWGYNGLRHMGAAFNLRNE
jgi:hypothetical protein